MLLAAGDLFSNEDMGGECCKECVRQRFLQEIRKFLICAGCVPLVWAGQACSNPCPVKMEMKISRSVSAVNYERPIKGPECCDGVRRTMPRNMRVRRVYRRQGWQNEPLA